MVMREEGNKMRRSIYATMSFVTVIWGVKIIEFTFDINLGQYGILPRTLSGSIGIFTAPFIHGDIYHLISNSLPLLILGIGLFYFYDKIATAVILIIYLMTGFWVWIAARDAYHIGASGVVYGMLTFLLFSGFIRRDSRTLAISFIVLFLYGGSFFAGIVPEDSAISWESHLMGAVAGIFCAVYYKNFKLSNALNHDLIDEDDEEPPASRLTYHFKPKSSDTKKEENKSYIIKYPAENRQKQSVNFNRREHREGTEPTESE